MDPHRRHALLTALNAAAVGAAQAADPGGRALAEREAGRAAGSGSAPDAARDTARAPAVSMAQAAEWPMAPGAAAPPVHERRIADPSRAICVPQWYEGGGMYIRFQRLMVWSGSTGVVQLRRKNIEQAAQPLPDHTPARSYGLLVGGKRVAEAVFAAGQSELELRFPLAGLAPGWHELDLAGLQEGESFITWLGYHHVPGAAPPKVMPVVQGSHAFAWYREGMHRWAWMPARYTPQPQPLTPKRFEPVTRGIVGRLVIPTDMGQDIVTPNVDKRGIWNTCGKQAYFFSDVMAGGPPVVPHVDGPRGVATAGLIVDIHIATPTQPGDAERDVEAYLMTANAWRKLMRDGSIVTLAGWVHEGAVSHWGDGAGGKTLRLVGDWRAVPANRRGYHDPWGTAWLQVETDEAAAPIPEEGHLRPHLRPPIGLVADSGHGRILAHQFNPRVHGPEAVVTEWMTGLSDPFGIVTWNGRVIVSERTAHRIVEIDPATRRVSRVVVQRNPGLPGHAKMSTWRRAMEPEGSLAERQAQPCLAPEMLRLWGDWLYYGSYASESVKRVHLVTGEVQFVLRVETERQSWFVNFDIARDNSFAPEGTIFYCTWGASVCAVSFGVLPDGRKWTGHRGQAPWNNPQAYAGAVAVGGGRMYYAGSAMGMTRFEAGAPIDPQRYQRGQKLFMREGGWLRFGPGGFNAYGLALPWGVDPDLDYYLAAHDLRRPGDTRQA